MLDGLDLDVSELLERIASLRPSVSRPALVQICAARAGEGTSFVAQAVADLVAREMARRVVLVRMDADEEAAPAGERRDEARPAAADSADHDDALAAQVDLSPRILIADGAAGLAETLSGLVPAGEVFVIDSPPLVGSFAAYAICQQASGAVLVIDAEETLAREAAAAKEILERAGANVLGIIVNRRRHRLPRWIAEAAGLTGRPRGFPAGRTWIWVLLAACAVALAAAFTGNLPGGLQDLVSSGETPAPEGND